MLFQTISVLVNWQRFDFTDLHSRKNYFIFLNQEKFIVE